MTIITRLRNWSIKHDKFSHFLLGIFLSSLFGTSFSLGFIISIELTQIDIFGIKGRIFDTIFDLIIGTLGIVIGIPIHLHLTGLN